MIEMYDRVVTKRIGPPIIGTVVGIIEGQPFYELWSRPLIALANWDQYYPEWKKGKVVTLSFEHSEFLYSVDELYNYALASIKKKVSADEVRQVLELVKLSKFAHYPMDDVERFDD